MDTKQLQDIIGAIQQSNVKDWFDYIIAIASLALSFKAPFYFTWDGYENLDFIKYATNPYTPKSIANIINKFRYNGQPDWNNMIHEDNEKKRAMLLPFYKMNNERKLGRQKPWYIKNKLVHRDFATFVDLSQQLVEEIRKWLKKHEADDLNFGQHIGR